MKMIIEKIKRQELKHLENSPIYDERISLPIPFVVVNMNNEVLFGEASISQVADYDGMVNCLVLDITDNMESRKMAFMLHYVGMTTMIDANNFNSMDCPVSSLKDLYLWSSRQFEEAAYKASQDATGNSEFDLF